MQKILILPIFAVLIFVLSYSIHDAAATSVSWTGGGDNIHWSDPSNWDTHMVPTSGDVITIPSGTVHLNINFTLTGSISIQASGMLVIDSGQTLTNSGTVTNSGKIVNNGGTITNNNLSAVDNTGTITNSGIITNHSVGNINYPAGMINTGSMVNYPTGKINSVGIFNNYGTINNNGTLTNDVGNSFLYNYGTINNKAGGLFENDFIVNNYHMINNSGAINNFESIYNKESGTINNDGVLYLVGPGLDSYGFIYNNVDGTITAQSVITNRNSGTIINSGTIHTTIGGEIDNYNIFENKAGGKINIEIGTFIINYYKLINNSGAVITNDGTIDDQCGSTFVNSGTFTGNAVMDLCLSCVAPASGDWIVTSCKLTNDVTAPANVIIQSEALLQIPSGKTLHIDFIHYHLLIKLHGKVLINAGGKLN